MAAGALVLGGSIGGYSRPVVGRQPAQRIRGGAAYHLRRRCRLLRCCHHFDGDVLCAAGKRRASQQLRWVFLVIGAIAFMDTFATWAGGFEKIVHWLDDT